ncbi:MAG: DNA-binding response regulator [Halobacteriovoraceae bacterium]|nr:DNA-binding response regulator [Halobacteriovoraceae bacterium]|tara:strand:+ start:10275 stop:10982 length:708 start_codon:yes stop_codon:yes gene_type:complete
MKKILIVEDEKHIAEGLKFNLTKQGHEIKVVYSGTEAVESWKDYDPDLIILDLMLPGLDGFKVLENIRLYNEKLPIIILSARSAVEDKVRCFKKGVDDYLSKPFNLDELILRVERNLKRSNWIDSDQDKEVKVDHNLIFNFSHNSVDFNKQKAVSAKEEIDLTIQELKLLKTFFDNEGKVLSRKYILEHAFSYSVEASSRTVDNFIVRFRKYFETDPKKPRHFISKRTQGYMFKS